MSILAELERELKRQSDPHYAKAQQWFFKEGITLYGVRIGQVRKIATQVFKQLPRRDKTYIFAQCTEVLRNEHQETSVIAYQWASRCRKEFTPSDFTRFEDWLKKYVHNWAQCDDLCTGPFGELLLQYPELIAKTYRWRRSSNRWVRRAAAVVLIPAIKKKIGLAEVFATTDALLTDNDDLVRKGYGWLLKEASNVFPKEVFAYVLKHKDTMPRVALRYAIEKMPKEWRKQAME